MKDSHQQPTWLSEDLSNQFLVYLGEFLRDASRHFFIYAFPYLK